MPEEEQHKQSEEKSEELSVPSMKEKKLAQVLVALVKQCQAQRAMFVEIGDETQRNITGEDDPFKDMPGDLGFDVKVLVPRLKAMHDPMAANLMTREPRPSVRPRVRANEDYERFAANGRDVVTKSLHEHNIRSHSRMGIKEATSYPLSAMLVDKDTERGLARASWVSIKRSLWDVESTGMADSMRWTGMEFTVPIETARERYGKDKDGKKILIEPDSSMLTMNSRESRRELIEDLDVISENDFLKRKTLVRLWWRGDEPNVDDADLDSKDNVTSDDNDSLMPRRNTEFIIDMKSKRILVQRDWSFVIDHDAHPMKFLVLDVYPNAIAKTSPLSPYVHLQRVMHHFYTVAANTFINTMKSVYLYRQDVLGDSFKEALRSASNLVCHDIQEDVDLDKLGQYFQQLPLNGVSEKNFQTISFFEGLFKEASQADDFSSSQISGTQKATNAQIMQNRADSRITTPADQVDDWMKDILRSMLQVSLSTMTGEEVGRWIGKERVGEPVEVEVPVDAEGNPLDITPQFDQFGNPVDEEGNPVTFEMTKIYPYWPELSTREIRSELELEIRPGSMRKRSEQETIQNLIEMQRNFMGFAGGLNERLAPNGERVTTEAETRVYNAITAELLDLMGLSDMDFLFFNNDDVESINPPGVPIGSELDQQALQLQNEQQGIDLASLVQQAQQAQQPPAA